MVDFSNMAGLALQPAPSLQPLLLARARSYSSSSPTTAAIGVTRQVRPQRFSAGAAALSCRLPLLFLGSGSLAVLGRGSRQARARAALAQRRAEEKKTWAERNGFKKLTAARTGPKKDPETKLKGRKEVISKEPTQAQADTGRKKRVDGDAPAYGEHLDAMPDYGNGLVLRARAVGDEDGKKKKKELPWFERMSIRRTAEQEESLQRLKGNFDFSKGTTANMDNSWGRNDYKKVAPAASGKAVGADSGATTAMDFEASVGHKAVMDLKLKANEPTTAKSTVEDFGLEQDFLDKLMDMSQVERADLVDDITRKGFVLLEAGELKEAKTLLDRASNIGVAFQSLQEDKLGLPKRNFDKKAAEQQEGEVLAKMQRDLVRDDFLRIFGADAKHGRAIGSF